MEVRCHPSCWLVFGAQCVSFANKRINLLLQVRHLRNGIWPGSRGLCLEKCQPALPFGDLFFVHDSLSLPTLAGPVSWPFRHRSCTLPLALRLEALWSWILRLATHLEDLSRAHCPRQGSNWTSATASATTTSGVGLVMADFGQTDFGQFWCWRNFQVLLLFCVVVCCRVLSCVVM